MLYNVVFISAAQHRDSAICIHVTPPSEPPSTSPHPTPLGHHRAKLPVLYSSFPLAIYFTQKTFILKKNETVVTTRVIAGISLQRNMQPIRLTNQQHLIGN